MDRVREIYTLITYTTKGAAYYITTLDTSLCVKENNKATTPQTFNNIFATVIEEGRKRNCILAKFDSSSSTTRFFAESFRG